ncbi:MAG TPA: hypothetical protein VNX86_04820 [Rhizomicrobium sp.]|jgi:hypothetical protein|nr:hypothetical protein [Rhizomicrobium sp.]
MRAVALALALAACSHVDLPAPLRIGLYTVTPRADVCDVPNILPQVQNPPPTWRSACVIAGVKFTLP